MPSQPYKPQNIPGTMDGGIDLAKPWSNGFDGGEKDSKTEFEPDSPEGDVEGNSGANSGAGGRSSKDETTEGENEENFDSPIKKRFVPLSILLI